MSGLKPRVSPLESRKRLLIAESELNRARLRQEWQTLAAEAGSLADRARSFANLGSAIIAVVGGFAAFRARKPAPAAAKSSWLQKIASGARLVCSLGAAFARGPGQDNE